MLEPTTLRIDTRIGPARPRAMGDKARFYSVSELAREFDITPRAIRFYEDKGLLAPERVGGNRIYDYRDKGRLALILRLKEVGFALDAIKDYLDLYDSEETRTEQLKVGYRSLSQRIAEQGAELAAIETNLAKLRELKAEAVAMLRERGVDPERDL